MMSSSSITLTDVQQQLTIFVYPVWLVFGITGCLLNLLIFSRPQLRTTSFSIYFFAASFDHLLTLIVGIGPVLYSLNHPDPQTHSLAFCKLRGYFFQICLMLSRWFVAFACIDRYVLTCERVSLRNMANRKIAKRAIATATLVWIVICSHRLIFYEIKDDLCGIVNSIGAALYHGFYVIVGGGLCPALIMITCAYLIHQNLAHKEQRRMQLSMKDGRKRSLDQQVLRMLFIQIICYIIFIVPQLGNLIFNTISIAIINQCSTSLVVDRFVAFMAELVLYMFPVTSFYLYTLTSRTFRSELKKLIRGIFPNSCEIQITPTTDGTMTVDI
ncbi:unnamed protein product [Adineta ricciae]|uniref:G-protein coupled receptors family 1 profile domain-containing protein n=1 Tax=Adineta ricciae TaxID=249248 RepID=A0A814T5M6_ADIRI|nr:unnamed protein product [Adineta ricciae]CAF1153777.1 unnamed protein product [Adineta ricciae]